MFLTFRVFCLSQFNDLSELLNVFYKLNKSTLEL